LDFNFGVGLGWLMSPSVSEIPPEAEERDISIRNGKALGPGGKQFGKTVKLGLINIGTTPIAKFIEDNKSLFSAMSPSLLRVMRAVSANEGLLEAVNTWDAAFLSFGCYQWTAGAQSDKGELAHVLNQLKIANPTTFTTYFGKNGLDVVADPVRPRVLTKGFLVLNGKKLDTPAKKAALRTPIWAYRFWRAGHDPDVRRCEIEQAMARVDIFYRLPQPSLGGKTISDLITSEHGVALLLDQHINRPGHVPKTLVEALSYLKSTLGKKDPKTWTTADEKQLVARYILRRAKTSMTNSSGRAKAIGEAVKAGNLSDKRGSFV